MRKKVEKKSNFFFTKILQICSGGTESVQSGSLGLRTCFPTPKHAKKSFLDIFKKSTFRPENRFLGIWASSRLKNVFLRVEVSKNYKWICCLWPSKAGGVKLVITSTILSTRFLISGLLCEKSIFEWPLSSAFTQKLHF